MFALWPFGLSLSFSLLLMSCTKIVHDRIPAEPTSPVEIVGGGTQASGGTGDLFGGGGSYDDKVAKNRRLIAKALRLIAAGTDRASLCRRNDDLESGETEIITAFLAAHAAEMATLAKSVDVRVVSTELTVAGHAVKARVGKPAGATNPLVEIRSTAFDAREDFFLTVHELSHLVADVPDFENYRGFPGQPLLDGLGRCVENYYEDHSAAGELDVTLNGTGYATVAGESLNEAAAAPDGSIYVVSTVARNGHGECVVRRYVDGAPVWRFESVTSGFQSTEGAGRLCNTIAIGTDGKPVVAGVLRFSDVPEKMFIMRLTGDGALDTTFGNAGDRQIKVHPQHSGATKLAVRADGRIAVAGVANNGTRMGIVGLLLRADGSSEPGFNTSSAINLGSKNNMVWSTTFDASGAMVVAGAFSDDVGKTEGRSIVLRLNGDGSLDPVVNGSAIPVGGGIGSPRATIALPAGGFLVAGRVGDADSLDAKSYLAIYRADGTRETAFGNDGVKMMGFGTGGSNFYSLAGQADGKFLVAGSAVDVTGAQAAVMRLLPTGAVDPSFVQRGHDAGRSVFSIENGGSALRRILPLPDGRIALVGTTRLASGANGFFVARLYGDWFARE